MRLNFRLMGYCLRYYLQTIRYGNDCTTTLLLEVFTQRNYVADFNRLKLTFIQKTQTSFWATLWRLRGNVCTPSIARGKAHSRLSICHNWTFFTISYGWDVIKGNLSKSALFEGRRVTFGEYVGICQIWLTDKQTELRQQYHALHYMQSHSKKYRGFLSTF